MADFFVDKILHNAEVEKKWFHLTVELIKLNGFKEMFDELLRANVEAAEKTTIPKHFFKGNLNITDIADNFGLKPLKKELRICPFHKDTNPSLSLSNEKGVFHCFGCGVKGNIITFYAKLKKLQNGNKGRVS